MSTQEIRNTLRLMGKHLHSLNVQSIRLGCLQCMNVFTRTSAWYNHMLICPVCGCNCVIGDAIGIPINNRTLQKIHSVVYGETDDLSDLCDSFKQECVL